MPATPASTAATARRWSKWMSATRGTGDSATRDGRAARRGSSGTATLTIAAPAVASARICAERGLDIVGPGVGHRLDDDRSAAPYGHVAHHHL